MASKETQKLKKKKLHKFLDPSNKSKTTMKALGIQ
jgi:hypothetical protein